MSDPWDDDSEDVAEPELGDEELELEDDDEWDDDSGDAEESE